MSGSVEYVQGQRYQATNCEIGDLSDVFERIFIPAYGLDVGMNGGIVKRNEHAETSAEFAAKKIVKMVNQKLIGPNFEVSDEVAKLIRKETDKKAVSLIPIPKTTAATIEKLYNEMDDFNNPTGTNAARLQSIVIIKGLFH